MAIFKFSMDFEIGDHSEGDGIRVEFDATGVDITDASGRNAHIDADHMDKLFGSWGDYKTAVAAALAKVAAR